MRTAVSPFIAIAALVLVGCGGDATEETTEIAGDETVIASDNGAIELVIPSGALPDGVFASDISVSAVLVEAGATLEDNTAPDESRPVAVFDLQPSGLEFLTPITASLRIRRDTMVGPLVIYHVTDDSIEPVDIDYRQEVDPDFIEATVEIASFSDLIAVTMWIAQADLYAVTQAVDRTVVPVKETFNASATITRLAEDRVVDAKLWVATGRDEFGDPIGEVRDVRYQLTHTRFVWFLHGTVKVMEPAPALRRSRIVTPAMVDEPLRERLEDDVYRTDPTTRTCDSAGAWDVYYQAYATSSYSAVPTASGLNLPTITSGPHARNVNVFREQGSVPGMCVDVSATTATTSGIAVDRPPTVEPIVATVDLPRTTYTVSATDPDGDTLSYSWSGNNCGGLAGADTSTMIWTHGDDVCPHTTNDHLDATIVVVVTAGRWEVTCRYVGAAAGSGQACEPAVAKP